MGTNPLDVTRVMGDADAGGEPTRMGAPVSCPVCAASNGSLETYCSECGFMLSSQPGSTDEPEPASCPFALVEDRTGRRLPLHEGVNQVGRENCDILLMEPTVSRRHAQITVADGSVDVLDHGSTNGTQVDGAPLTAGASRTAKPGAVLRFGSATFVLTGPIDGLEPQQPAPVAHTSAGPPGAGGDTTAGPEGAVATNAIARLASQEGADILIAPGGSTIGRRATNTHVISGDPYVSGAHAELLADDTGVRLTDLGSTNGTVVNGRRLVAQEPVELADGDEVAFGQSRYVFEVLEDSGARDEEEWEDDELPTDFDELDAVNAAPPADPA